MHTSHLSAPVSVVSVPPWWTQKPDPFHTEPNWWFSVHDMDVEFSVRTCSSSLCSSIRIGLIGMSINAITKADMTARTVKRLFLLLGTDTVVTAAAAFEGFEAFSAWSAWCKHVIRRLDFGTVPIGSDSPRWLLSRHPLRYRSENLRAVYGPPGSVLCR